MIRVLIAGVSLVALAACAGLEPAGRNASRGPSAAPPPPVAVSTPTPAPVLAPPPVRVTEPAPPPAAAPAPMSPRPEAAPTRANPGVAPAIPATPAPAPNINAPPVAAPPPAPSRIATAPRDNEIVVPGGVERQVPAPNGDPRNAIERMEDIRAWDQCVTAVQSAYESNPMRPQLDSPEEYCSRSLGMASRNGVPESRRERRR